MRIPRQVIPFGYQEAKTRVISWLAPISMKLRFPDDSTNVATRSLGNTS